jgi:hypothetical protein
MAGAALGGDCAIRATGGDRASACAINSPSCGCQQSSLQLKVSASGTGAAAMAVTGVRVLDEKTGQLLQTLSARSPQKWAGSAYGAWDQQIADGDFNVTYDLSGPDWSVLQPSGLLQTGYRVEAEVTVGGVVRLIGIDGVTREAPIST